MCIRLRAGRGDSGLIVTHGGPFSKAAAGLYSTQPAGWRDDDSATIQRHIDEAPRIRSVFAANGSMEIETYTVKYGRDGLVGIVAGRLASSGERALATATGDDELALLVESDPLGMPVFLRNSDFGNRMTLSQR
jgi:acetyl-CoA C-acetyltransferase